MVFLLNLGNQIITYLWVSCYTRSVSSSRRADMFAVSSESSFAFSFNIICCSIFQSCRLLCFAVLECNVKPSLIYSGIKCSLCIAKQHHPLKLILVKDCWLEKSIATSKTIVIHSAIWDRKFNIAFLTSSQRFWTASSYWQGFLWAARTCSSKSPQML